MLLDEFAERTHYTPDYDEYHYIEEAYYDFDGNKDEFCNWWKKENSSGRWKRELKLRKKADEEYRQLYDASMAYKQETEETLSFYRERYEDHWEQKKALSDEVSTLKYKYGCALDELEKVQKQYSALMDALSVLKEAIK